MKHRLLSTTISLQNTSIFHIYSFNDAVVSLWIAACHLSWRLIRYSFLLIFALLLLQCTDVHAHGGVFLEDDVCVIQIGFYKAHFTIYQPQKSQHKEYCEDIPHVSESVFVMEYLHDGLKEAPIDFRIVKDVLGRGRFFQAEDLQQITDINEISEFYQAPVIQPEGVLLALHQFKEEGNYIGIVTANIPNNEEQYIAVFPFRVGGKNWGYIPLIIALVIFLQINYWLLNGGYGRIRRKFISMREKQDHGNY